MGLYLRSTGRTPSRQNGEFIVLYRLFARSRGQGLVEYALIILFVAIVVVAAIALLGPQIASIFKNINNGL